MLLNSVEKTTIREARIESDKLTCSCFSISVAFHSWARSELFVASSVPHLFPSKQPIIVFIQTNFRAFVWKNIATLKFSLIEKIFWEQTEQREKKEERNFVLMTSCKAGFDELEGSNQRFRPDSSSKICCTHWRTGDNEQIIRRTWKWKCFIEPPCWFYNRFTFREILCSFVLNKSSMKKSFWSWCNFGGTRENKVYTTLYIL